MTTPQVKNLLVVDDEPDIRTTIRNFLGGEGFGVLTASNGLEALETLRSRPIDLIISDLRMPEMDGSALLREAKAMDGDLEVIILTAYASVENVIDALGENGAFSYLIKPVDDPDTLLNTIRRALERRELRIRNRELMRELIEKQAELEAKNQRLNTALKEIKTLRGIVPICSICKNIRDDKGYWNRLESYIEKHSEAAFSHGICPECMETHYGDEEWYEEMKDDDDDT